MFGVRSEADKERSREGEPFRGLTRKIPVALSAVLRRGEASSLTATLGELSVTVCGEVPQEAKTAPLTEEAVRRQLTKLGATPFEATELSLLMDEGLMLPVSALNALRRAAIEALEKRQKEAVAAPAVTLGKAESLAPKMKRMPQKSAVFYNASVIPEEAYSFFDHIYLSPEQYDGRADGVLLPPVIYDSERESVKTQLLVAVDKGAKHALVGNLGHLALARECGLIPHGDFRLNLCNPYSVAAAEELGLADLILSPELTLPKLRDAGGATAAIVYGRVPLMITEACLAKAASGCDKCGEGRGVLTDRKGISFPVLRLPPHRNLILNSVPIYMADRADDLARMGVTMQHFIFTTETKEEIRDILEAYQNGLPPKNSNVRRIR
jgi:putative protease